MIAFFFDSDQVYLNVQPTTSMMLRSVFLLCNLLRKKPWSSYSPWCSSHRHSFPSTQKVSQENKIITLDFHIIHPHHKKVMVVLPPSIVISDYYGDLGTQNFGFSNTRTVKKTPKIITSLDFYIKMKKTQTSNSI